MTAGYPEAGDKAVNSASYWSQYVGHNCTNYVAYRMIKNGMPAARPAALSGNASNWGPSFPMETTANPAVGAMLINRILKPLDMILISRDHIQETLDEAAERGRVTRSDANDLVAELVRRGRQQTEDILRRARRAEPLDQLVRGRWGWGPRSRSPATTSSRRAR